MSVEVILDGVDASRYVMQARKLYEAGLEICSLHEKICTLECELSRYATLIPITESLAKSARNLATSLVSFANPQPASAASSTPQTKGNENMSGIQNNSDFVRLQNNIAEIGTATTDAANAVAPIGTRIAALVAAAQAVGSDPSPEDLAALKTAADNAGGDADQLKLLVTALTAMGTDPTNPVPEPVPTPQPEPAPDPAQP